MANPKGTEASVFKIPTLGHAVCLGELYDQRSGNFLGVQLYPQDKILKTDTDIRHTDLSLSLSTSIEDKATLLDINAKMSLEVLGGLVKVSGSASYFNDSKSNTHEHAFALALKMRLNEKRILFAEKEMGRDVLEVAQEDYIATKKATHFVSAIVYGGTFIVNLVARKSKQSEQEKIDGKLEAEFNSLKGAISLHGEVSADIRAQFANMNDNFDLIVHGDVALEKVPINPQDVLDTFPNAAELISAGGGVPISVTLQPIPQKLLTGSLVYELDANCVDKILKAFSLLDDLDSRFSVLIDRIKVVRGFVPKLDRVVREAVSKFTEEHGRRLSELRKFLYDYQHGTGPESKGTFGADEDGGMGGRVLKAARDLYDEHLDPTRRNKAPDQYPESLVGLENEFSKFQYFVADIQRVQKSGKPHSPTNPGQQDPQEQSSVRLSSLEDVCRAARIQDKVPLFVMTPLAPTSDNFSDTDEGQFVPPTGPNADLALVKFMAIIRKYSAYFNDSDPAYIVYAESLNRLERRLPNDGKFVNLTTPSLFIGRVDVHGTLSWSAPPETLERPLYLRHNLKNMSYKIDPVNGTQSFSILIHGKAPDPASSTDKDICIVQCAKGDTDYLKFQTPLRVELQRDGTSPADIRSSTDVPQAGKPFTATFVQDTNSYNWLLYLGDKRVGQISFQRWELLKNSKELQIAYPSGAAWWGGEVYKVKAFTYALNQKQVAAEAKKAEAEEN